MKNSVALVGWIVACTGVAPAGEPAGWKDIFNGQDLEGWTAVIEDTPVGEDPGKYIVVKDKQIVMYADTPEDATVKFGTILTRQSWSRYALSFQYRWLGPRFDPRKDKLRDAGLLYHVREAKAAVWNAWPVSFECQVQEGDTGDIVLIDTRALSWGHAGPDQAPEGQGDPGMLPENGGIPLDCEKGKYLGRYPVADKTDRWNRVEVIVQAGETAVHKVNGVTRSRLSLLSDGEGKPLDSGMLGLQLEGARISYQDIRLLELPEPLRTSSYAALSSVHGIPNEGRELVVSNPTNAAVPIQTRLIGKDANSFSFSETPGTIPAGGTIKLEVSFKPKGKAGRYSAGLQIGHEHTGAFVILQGLATDALEGENEPPLERIVHSLGIPLDVGGGKLALGTEAPTLGQSKAAKHFRKVGIAPVKMTPLARYSPPGEYAFGWADSTEHRVGALADSTATPDAHQRLFPPLADGGKGGVEFDPGDGDFSLFIRAGKLTVGTDPEKHPSKLKHPFRVYPVEIFMGQKVSNAVLIGFEEAANGDYQDSLFLVENVRIVGNP